MAKKRDPSSKQAISSLTEKLEITLRWPKVYNDDIVYFVQILSVEWQPFGDARTMIAHIEREATTSRLMSVT